MTRNKMFYPQTEKNDAAHSPEYAVRSPDPIPLEDDEPDVVEDGLSDEAQTQQAFDLRHHDDDGSGRSKTTSH